jgi:hypothetical protein
MFRYNIVNMELSISTDISAKAEHFLMNMPDISVRNRQKAVAYCEFYINASS